MLNIQPPIVVGIFRDHTQVEQAINELHQIGFDHRHVRFAKHGISIRGMLKKIESLYGGQSISTCEIYEDLVGMGMPVEDARYYQSEFEAGHSIIAVQRSGVPLVATSILIRNGGYIVNEHFAQLVDYDQGPNKSAHIYVRFLKELVRLTLSTVNRCLTASQPTSQEEPPTEAINTQHNSPNERIAQSTNKDQYNEIQEVHKDLVNA